MTSSQENEVSYELLVENDYVRVTRAKLPVTQTAAARSSTALPTVSIDLDSKRVLYSDAKSPQRSGKASSREIRVELKSPPPEVSLPLDAVRLDPGRDRL